LGIFYMLQICDMGQTALLPLVVQYWKLNLFVVCGVMCTADMSIMIHSFISLACAEFDDSLSFSAASCIPLYELWSCNKINLTSDIFIVASICILLFKSEF
jgi:hypothetical protein